MSGYSIGDEESSFETKSLWSGSVTPLENRVLSLTPDGNMMVTDQKYTERVLSILEELMINVADIHVKNVGAIRCNIGFCDNVFTIANYGAGFNIEWIEEMQAWLPFILTVYPNQGTEFYKKQNSITGGVNGLGLKITCRSCEQFMLVTGDSKTRRKYTLRLTHRGKQWIASRSQQAIATSRRFDREQLPFVIQEECTDYSGESFTEVTILPRYRDYQMDNPFMIEAMYKNFVTMVNELNLYMRIPVTINGAPLIIKSLEQYVRCYLRAHTRSEQLDAYSEFALDPDNIGDIYDLSQAARDRLFNEVGRAVHYPLRIALALTNTNSQVRWACVNGVVIRQNAATNQMFVRIISQVMTYLEMKIQNFKEVVDFVKNNISVFVVGAIPSPSWQSQSKRGFSIDRGFMEAYVIDPSHISAFVKPIEQYLKAHLNQNLLRNIKDAIKNTKKLQFRHPYTHCASASQSVNPKIREQIFLFLSEGDSAEKAIRSGFGGADPALPWSKVGMLQSFGVPLNVRRKYHDINGVKMPDVDVINNDFWRAFTHIMNLEYGETYDTPEKLARLNYGNIVICTDQDVDGEGKITSLMINFIEIFFPGLLQHGRVFRLVTDLIRVFDGPRYVMGFSNDRQFKDWALENHYYSLISSNILSLTDDPQVRKAVQSDAAYGIGTAAVVTEDAIKHYLTSTHKMTRLRVEYYKGLGTHGSQFCEYMFNSTNFWQNLVVFYFDKMSTRMFNVFFEEDSGPRKDVILKYHEHFAEIMANIGPQHFTLRNADKQHRINVTSCSKHLITAMVDYTLTDLERKLPTFGDGLNDVKRRILYTTLLHMNRDTYYNVDQFAGIVAEKSRYHHATTGMQSSISICAQNFFGSRRLPFFLPYGEFGTRNNTTPAQGRYIKVKRNNELLDALYSLEDIPLLDWQIEDGQKTIPRCFYPVIPPIYETSYLPSQGWQVSIHALDIFQIIDETRRMIDGATDVFVNPKYDTNGWRGSLPTIKTKNRSRTISFGDYSFDEATNTVTVTELPFLMTGTQYVDALTARGVTEDGDKRRPIYTDHPFIDNFSHTSIINQSSGKIKAANEIKIMFKVKASKLLELNIAFVDGVQLPPKYAFMYNIGLYNYIYSQFNFTHYNSQQDTDKVLSFSTYAEIALRWFTTRQPLYVERLARRKIILTYRRERFRLINLAIESGLVGRISTINTVAEIEEMLRANNIPPLNEKLLGTSAEANAIRTVDLPYHISGHVTLQEYFSGIGGNNPSVKHDYLIDLPVRQTSLEKVRERASKIREIDAELRILDQPDHWKTVWKEELDKLEAVCRKYLPDLWTNAYKIKI